MLPASAPFVAPPGLMCTGQKILQNKKREESGDQAACPSTVRPQVTKLRFTPEHARSYNELVEVIERNLLLADWQDEDHVESLLSCRTSK